MTMPTVKSARPQYPPPVPTDGIVDPGGPDPVTRAHRLQQVVAQQYSQWRAAHHPDIAPDVLKANAGAFSQAPALRQLDAPLSAVKERVDRAASKVNDALKDTRVSPDAEVRAGRVWQRAVRTLDTKKSPGEITAAAQALIANAGDDLPVYVEELSPYLESRGVPTGFLTAAYAAAIPGLEDAQQDATLLAKQHAVLRSNHDRLTKAVAADVDPPQLLDPHSVDASSYTDESTAKLRH